MFDSRVTHEMNGLRLAKTLIIDGSDRSDWQTLLAKVTNVNGWNLYTNITDHDIPLKPIWKDNYPLLYQTRKYFDVRYDIEEYLRRSSHKPRRQWWFEDHIQENAIYSRLAKIEHIPRSQTMA